MQIKANRGAGQRSYSPKQARDHSEKWSRGGHACYHLSDTTVTEVLVFCPAVSLAVAVMTSVPRGISQPGNEAEQEVVLVHVLRVLLPAVIVIDAIALLLSLAVIAMLRFALPLSTVPFAGEVIATVGGVGAAAGVVIEMLDDWAEVLPAVL